MVTLLFKDPICSFTKPSSLPHKQNPLDKNVSNLWKRRVGEQKPLTALMIPSKEWAKIQVKLNRDIHPTLFSLIQSGTINNFSMLVEHLKREACDLEITNTEIYHTFGRDLTAESILVLDKLIEETNFNIANRENRLWNLIPENLQPEEKNYQTWNTSIKSIDVSSIEELKIEGFGNTQLTRIPFGVFDLKYLEFLSLKRNKLTFIPEEISLFQELITLDLSNNQLMFLPRDLFELQNLRFLRLSHNYLQVLPQEINKLQNLTELNLSNNKLIYLPREIGILEYLDELYLNNNNLYFLPNEISGLFNLERLDLSNNRLSRLSPSIGNLENLQVLDLSNNQLTTLPEAFEKFFPKLQEPHKKAFYKLIDAEKLTKTRNILESIRYYQPS